jgi:uncharacterized protein
LIYPSSEREPWVDGLRALALLGVFIVNAMGYPFAPNYPLPAGSPQPADSVIALVIHGAIIACVQSKALPLLCLLFGYSLCIVAEKVRGSGLDIKNVLRTRYQKLLLIGVLHGVLIYFGDILTMYAICGLILGRWASLRPKKLLKIWRQLTIAVIALGVLMLFSGAGMLFDLVEKSPSDISNEINNRLFLVSTLREFWLLNLNTYFEGILFGWVLLPVLLWVTVAGMLTRRFKLLSMRRFSRYFWTRHLSSWQLTLAIILNCILGIASIIVHISPGVNYNHLMGIVTLGVIPGMWLVACLLAWGMRRWHKVAHLPKWIIWLAPAGRHTLLMYLSLSVTLMLSSHVFFGFNGSTPMRFCIVLFAWMVTIFVAKTATIRGWRDPLARWLTGAATAPKIHA